MKQSTLITLAIGLLLSLSSFPTIQTEAQVSARYCYHRIRDIEWSPDGQQLAVMTSQGALVYDADMNLIRTIEAPDLGHPYDGIYSQMLWSPDSQWMILPQLYDLEFHQRVAGYGGWSIANAQTGDIRPMSAFYYLRELAWSPDNQFILSLRYDPGIGLAAPFSELTIRTGIRDEPITPIKRVFEEIEFEKIQWHDDNTISVQYDNITVYMDTNLELLERAPTINPQRWVSNAAGNWEAGMTPEIYFAVREDGGEPVTLIINALRNSNRESVRIGHVSDIIWLNDDESLIGVYGKNNLESFLEEHPDLPRLLQGIVVHAPTATVEMQFLLEADGDVTGYSVSTRGDRIAVFRDDLWIELWNPLTEERLTTIEIEPLTNMDDC